ncbi:MAG: hypothetical protein MJZ57_10105 [Bacteroidales bacterium]|nr:hypothetical protein [Bacteroidales bacterium]
MTWVTHGEFCVTFARRKKNRSGTAGVAAERQNLLPNPLHNHSAESIKPLLDILKIGDGE